MDLSSTSIYPAQHTQPSHSTPNNQQAKFQNEHQATSHPNLCMPVYEQHSQYMLKIEQHDADSDMMKSELHHSPSVQNDQHSYEHAPQHSSRQVYQDTSAVHSPDYNECMSPNSQHSIEGTPVKKRGRPKGSLNKKTIWGNSLGNPDQEAPVLPIPKVPSLTASGKRKGRPPGSKNKKTLALEQFVDHEAFLSTDTPSDFTNEPVLYDTPSTPNSIIDASSLSENSLSVTQFNKRKGRPPGSKNKKTLAAERGDPYVDNKTHERRPRGRPKTNTAPCDPSSEKRRRGRPVFNPQKLAILEMRREISGLENLNGSTCEIALERLRSLEIQSNTPAVQRSCTPPVKSRRKRSKSNKPSKWTTPDNKYKLRVVLFDPDRLENRDEPSGDLESPTELRGHGLPRSHPDSSGKKRRGRPRIHPVKEVKLTPNGERRGRGRPRIHPPKVKSVHPRGRRKRERNSSVVGPDASTPKRKRGRPRKHATQDFRVSNEFNKQIHSYEWKKPKFLQKSTAKESDDNNETPCIVINDSFEGEESLERSQLASGADQSNGNSGFNSSVQQSQSENDSSDDESNSPDDENSEQEEDELSRNENGSQDAVSQEENMFVVEENMNEIDHILAEARLGIEDSDDDDDMDEVRVALGLSPSDVNCEPRRSAINKHLDNLPSEDYTHQLVPNSEMTANNMRNNVTTPTVSMQRHRKNQTQSNAPVINGLSNGHSNGIQRRRSSNPVPDSGCDDLPGVSNSGLSHNLVTRGNPYNRQFSNNHSTQNANTNNNRMWY